jgi:transposase
VTARNGKPVVSTLTAGQRHESPQAIPLLEQATDRMWPEAVAGDKGSSSAELRNWLLQHEIEAVIPYREDEMGPHDYDRARYRERPVIERTINRLKRYRRIATRYEKLASSYLAMATIGMILEWL